jgi:hypothetical protein
MPSVVAALEVMYAPSSTQQNRKNAQDYLLQVQQGPHLWDIAWNCLQHDIVRVTPQFLSFSL